MADPATDAAIAARWPAAWARANNPALRNRSKARQQIRKRYEHAVALDAFIAANPEARCGNCAHSDRDPSPGIKGLSCQLDSDFHGFGMVKPESVCARWRDGEAKK